MGRTRHIAGLLLTALVGCGTGFVEPSPAQLQYLHVSRSEALRDEPVALYYIVDFSIADASSCLAALQSLPHAHEQSQDPLVREAHVLGVMNLSPGCQQAPMRRLQFDYVRSYLQAAEDAPPSPDDTVRPVVLYINNSGVELNFGLLADLKALQAPLKSTRRPFIWGYTSKAVRDQLLLPHDTVEWTFAADPELLPRFTAFLDERLPLQSSVSRVRAPALPQSGASSPQAVKLCGHSDQVVGGTLPLDGAAVWAAQWNQSPSQQPELQLVWTQRLALKPPLEPAPDATWDLELCIDHCDRTVTAPDGTPGPFWAESKGCAQETAP